MNLDRKTIIAFLLIGLVFIFVQTPIYQKIFFPQSYEQQQRQKEIEKQASQQKPEDVEIAEAAPPITQREERLKTTSPGVLSDLEKRDIKEIYIETDLYQAVFSSLGASLKGWQLKKYNKSDGAPVNMFSEEWINNLVISFIARNGDTVNTGERIFKQSVSDSVLELGEEPLTIRYILEIESNRKIIKEYTFYNHEYHFEMRITLENMGEIVADKSYSIMSPAGLLYTESKVSEDHYYAKAVVSAGDQVNKGYKSNGTLYRESGVIDWIAMRTKYFAFAIIPKTQKGISAAVLGREIPLAEYKDVKWKNFSIGLTMPFTRNDIEDKYRIFIGPMHDDLLKSYEVGLEKMLDMGAKIIQPFSIATLWMFKKIHTFVPNYGLVLIIFSILIKIIVSPLTHKSFESMKRMQKLQPRIAELKEKYAKDPQKLNTETMKIYKEEGVNPMGGCLPILLQMPLLWALYVVFRTTIELRQEGFIWWIKDLSSPDTIATLPFAIPLYGDSVNVLPVLMGLTMIWQQKMSITDPKQKALVYLMPVFMILIFNSFPSGLNLYYTLFNILSIIHQKYILGDKESVKPNIIKKR